MAKKSFFETYKLHVLTFVLLLGLGAWAGIERFASPVSVNELTPAVMIAKPAPSPSPTPACRGGVSSLKLSLRCGATGFTTYDFSCESGKTAQITSERCLEAGAIYDSVRAICANVCVGDK